MKKAMKRVLSKGLSILICIAILFTALPLNTYAATATHLDKFIKAEPQLFDPSVGEKTTISWNFEQEHITNIMVMNGNNVVTYITKDQTYNGGYKAYEINWDGKDSNGKVVKDGTYTVVVEPQDRFKRYKSIVDVTVLNANGKDIGITPNAHGDTFKVFGKGGKSQGINSVSLNITVNGKQGTSINATIDNNTWYADLPMTKYNLYSVKASINSGSGTITRSIDAVRHVFRVTDRIKYLAALYYGDYIKTSQIISDNNIPDDYSNDGKLVDTNIIIINPSKTIAQDISKDSAAKKQRLGLIDQLQRVASANPSSLTMGNNFYANSDISIDGYDALFFNRMYNSMSYSYNEFGLNWSNTYSYYLQDLDKAVAILFEDGHVEYYTKNSDGSYKTAEGLSRKLAKHGEESYTLTIDGSKDFNFSKDGKLTEVKDLNGNTLKLTYTADMLSKVENSSGYLNFTYNTDGTIKTVSDSAGRSVSYSYIAGLVSSFTDVNGNTTTYAYDALNRLSKVISPEKITALNVEYDNSDRVVKRTEQGSGTYLYSYDDQNRKIICTEPNGNKVTYNYTSDYRLASEEYSDGTMKYYYKDSSKSSTVAAYNSSEKAGGTSIVANSTTTAKATATATANRTATVDNKTKSEADYTVAYDFTQAGNNTKVLAVAPTENKLISLASSGTAASSDTLELETHNMNTATGTATNNTLYPQFKIKNTGSSDIALSDVTLRYYYTIDGDKPQNFWCDWSSAGQQNITGKFVKLDTPFEGADYYLEIGFKVEAGKLSSGKTTEVQVRIAKNDWGNFTPGDDYSQNLAVSYTSFDKVDVFVKGSLMWGKGSTGSVQEGNTDNNGNGISGNNSSNGNNAGNNGNSNGSTTGGTSDENITPSGTNKLKLQMYNTGNSGKTANTIHPMMRLVNTGKNIVKLEDIKIKYYYTADDNKPQNFWCDWSSAGQQNITGAFKTLSENFEGADTYLEVGFKAGSGYINIGEKLDIHIRIGKNDWTNYDITNDYSINPSESFKDWDKVDVFVKDEKVWGQGLIPGEEEVDESEAHIEYADTTFTPVRAEMFNTKTEDKSNFLAPRFRVYNTSSDDIRLSDINIRYFYTADGEEEQIFEPDYSAIGSKFQTAISKSEVTCGFTHIGDENLKTNCIANIGFTRDDIVIKPGEFVELHTRIHRKDWTNYIQTNDYSLNKTGTNYKQWNKIAVFVGGRWAWGSLPLTYAAIADPDSGTNYNMASKQAYSTQNDKAGNPTYYTYDDNGNITSTTDAFGNKTTCTYNSFNEVTTAVDALGNKTIYDYDTKGNLTTYTDPMGNKTNYEYNGKGWLTKTTRPDGKIESRTYDDRGNVKSITDANGNTINYEYNTLNRVTKLTDPKGNSEYYEYTADGRIKSVKDALGNAITTEYNADGQVTKETDKNGNSTLYKYNSTTGRLDEVTDPLSQTTKYEYDSMGNIKSIIAADGSSTSYEYDAFGRQKAVADANGNKTLYTYDVNGNLTTEKDTKGNVTKYGYDIANNLTQVTNTLGQITKYSYDSLGNLADVTRVSKDGSKNQVTWYQYNSNNQLTTITDPTGKVVKYEYDDNGQLINKTDKNGTATKYSYDGIGNVAKITYSDDRTVKFTYDETNLLESIDDWNGTTSIEYDVIGQTSKVTDYKNRELKYTWTKSGQKQSITYPNGSRIQYEYNACGNLTKVTDANNKTTTYAYDSLNRVKERIIPNGAITQYEYDSLGQLTARTEKTGSSVREKYNFDYDSNGNRIKKAKVAAGITETTSYVYDALNELVEVSDKNNTRKYSYDEFNNRAAKEETGKGKITYKYNRLNQLTEENQGSSSKVYSYDNQGNLTEVKAAGKTQASYTFDSTNMLSKAVTDKGSAEYKYDGQGNRINTKLAVDKTVMSDIDYIIDAETAYNDIVMAVDSVSGKESSYTYGEDHISVETAEIINYYVNNEINSVTDILDDSGKVQNTINYNEFGVIENPEVVNTNGNIFGYTGHVYDNSTGLHYAKARYYDPTVGRFISEDSYRGDINDPVSLNLYTYVNNNPINLFDPTGYHARGGVLSYNQDKRFEDVKELQKKLTDLGYMDEVLDKEKGYFGPKTVIAVNKFKDKYLPSGNMGKNRGKVGDLTWAYIDREYNKKIIIDNQYIPSDYKKTAELYYDQQFNDQIATLYGIKTNINEGSAKGSGNRGIPSGIKFIYRTTNFLGRELIYHYNTVPQHSKFILNALLADNPTYLANRKSITDEPMYVIENYYYQNGPAWIQILASWLKDVRTKYDNGQYTYNEYMDISNYLRDMLKCTSDGHASLFHEYLADSPDDIGWGNYFRDVNFRIVCSDESYANGNTADEIQMLIAAINGYVNAPFLEAEQTFGLCMVAGSFVSVVSSLADMIGSSSASAQAVERDFLASQMQKVEKAVAQAEKDAIISETPSVLELASKAESELGIELTKAELNAISGASTIEKTEILAELEARIISATEGTLEPSIAKRITKAINAAKPEVKLEGNTANALGDKVIGFQKNINSATGRVGEIDIETENCIIDCFNGVSSKEPSTFFKYFNEKAQYMNPSGKKVILYAPNIDTTKVAGIEAIGVKVVRTLDELKSIVGVN
jgi:RHS repeat-associated protein